MSSPSDDRPSLITRLTCCISFLAMVAVWVAISIHTWEMHIPDWKVAVIGATLMGYPIKDLLNSFTLGKK